MEEEDDDEAEEEDEAEVAEEEEEDDDDFEWSDNDGPHPDEAADQQRALVEEEGRRFTEHYYICESSKDYALQPKCDLGFHVCAPSPRQHRRKNNKESQAP
ncbi:hypothetical protein QYE76_023289 [Lolium multiflorum]|uniref:Uncharacterized protein n=1 Tax=Lolium multiflorum TaxID=4521 RepID=A0AAD8RCK4_LOLMU|nr:hypothetical protein QYE76_023289 [Lolium multiflorum]